MLRPAGLLVALVGVAGCAVPDTFAPDDVELATDGDGEALLPGPNCTGTDLCFDSQVRTGCFAAVRGNSA